MCSLYIDSVRYKNLLFLCIPMVYYIWGRFPSRFPTKNRCRYCRTSVLSHRTEGGLLRPFYTPYLQKHCHSLFVTLFVATRAQRMYQTSATQRRRRQQEEEVAITSLMEERDLELWTLFSGPTTSHVVDRPTTNVMIVLLFFQSTVCTVTRETFFISALDNFTT
jgi:hypothetical protein